MELVLTSHAQYRMALRRITRAMVKGAIEQPDMKTMGYSGRTVVLKKLAQGTVKVVYLVERRRHVVVTVMWEYPEEV